MIEKKKQPSSKFGRLWLERLEDRLAPAIVESFFGAAVNVPIGNIALGVDRPSAPFLDAAGGQNQVVMHTLTPIQATGNDLTLIPCAYNFSYASDADNAALVLTVKSYAAFANSTANAHTQTPKAGGYVGGDLYVTTNWVAPGNTLPPPPGTFATKGYWIQIVTTNTPATNSGTVANVPFLDTSDPTGATPFYALGVGDQSKFYDGPQRGVSGATIEWHADLFFVVQTAARDLTIYKDGISWGWDTEVRRSPWAAPGLTLASSANPAIPLQKVQFTATLAAIAGSGVPPPSGIITFVDTTLNALIGYVPIKMVNGQPTATVPASFAAAGVDTIVATYDGDVNYFGARSTLAQTINMAKAGVQLTPNTNTVALGQAVTFAASVFDVGLSGQIPTGVVNFFDGSSPLGNAVIDATGHAAFTTASLSSGSHIVMASYGGDGQFNGANGTTVEEVGSSSSGGTGTVLGMAWRDANGNGLQDTGESGLANIWVYLFTASGQAVAYTMTDTTGHYHFQSVAAGTYYLTFTSTVLGDPTTYVFAPKDQGLDDTKDSDVNALGRTDLFTLIALQTVGNLDAGLKPM